MSTERINKMRRSDREIKNIDEIIGVIKKCDVCRIAFNDGEYPYIVPMNFGMREENGKIELFFHCANEGKKLDLIKNNNKVFFEMDTSHRLIADVGNMNCTMEYESVMGKGYIDILPKEKKIEALNILMKQYHKENFPINEKILPITTLLRLTVEDISAKRRIKAAPNSLQSKV